MKILGAEIFKEEDNVYHKRLNMHCVFKNYCENTEFAIVKVGGIEKQVSVALLQYNK